MGTVKNTRHRESAIRRAQPLPFDIEVMLVPSCILGPEGCANAGFDQTCVGFAVGAGGAHTAWSGPQGKMASSGGGHSSTNSTAARNSVGSGTSGSVRVVPGGPRL